MRLRLGAIVVTALTIVIALITLLGLIGTGDLGTTAVLIDRSGLSVLSDLLVQTAGVVVAVAVLVGVLNLLGVHVRRLRTRSSAIPGLIVIVSFVVVVFASTLPFGDRNRAAIDGVQIALETAFSGLLLFSLVYGAVTITNRRPSWSSMLFVLTVIVVLIGSLPLAQVQPVARVVAWINAVPVDAGGRALLLGISLATVVAGVRVLIGQGRATRE